jgi:hypothetical protein
MRGAHRPFTRAAPRYQSIQSLLVGKTLESQAQFEAGMPLAARSFFANKSLARVKQARAS